MPASLVSSLWEIFGATITVFCAAGWMMGRALAQTWKSFYYSIVYGFFLALASRFFDFSLFNGQPLTVSGLVVDWLMIIFVALVGYRLTMVQKMSSQYPWLYERTGLFTFRVLIP